MRKINFIVSTFGAIAFLGSLLGGCTPDNPEKKANASSPATSAATKTTDVKSVETKTDATPKSDARIIKVKIDGLETYKHPTGLFQIDAPKDWKVQENKKPNEVIVLWFDPSKNALLKVDVFKAPTETTPEQLTKLLEIFLKSTFGSRQGFAAEKPVQEKDGSVQIVWSYDESIKNTTAKIQGNGFISRSGDKISLIITGGVADQIPLLKESFDRIVNSYKIDPAVEIPTKS